MDCRLSPVPSPATSPDRAPQRRLNGPVARRSNLDPSEYGAPRPLIRTCWSVSARFACINLWPANEDNRRGGWQMTPLRRDRLRITAGAKRWARRRNGGSQCLPSCPCRRGACRLGRIEGNGHPAEGGGVGAFNKTWLGDLGAQAARCGAGPRCPPVRSSVEAAEGPGGRGRNCKGTR